MILSLLLCYIFTGTSLAFYLNSGFDKISNKEYFNPSNNELINNKNHILKTNSCDNFHNREILEFIKTLDSMLEWSLNEISSNFMDDNFQNEIFQNNYNNDETYEDDLIRSRRQIERYNDTSVAFNDSIDPSLGNQKPNKTEWIPNLNNWIENIVPDLFNSSVKYPVNEVTNRFEEMQNGTLSATEKSNLILTLTTLSAVKENLTLLFQNVTSKISNTTLGRAGLLRVTEQPILKDGGISDVKSSSEKIRKILLQARAVMNSPANKQEDGNNDNVERSSTQGALKVTSKEDMYEEVYDAHLIHEGQISTSDIISNMFIMTAVALACIIVGALLWTIIIVAIRNRRSYFVRTFVGTASPRTNETANGPRIHG
uniref:Uncharacterized protein n=1 Tax=Clastoptera arizonana TaxID=38151 RepID=A0A1B6DBU8_9HEMI